MHEPNSLEGLKKAKINMAMENPNLNFGQLLRTVRKSIGVMLGKVSEDTGFDTQKLRNFERNCFQRDPNEDDIKKIAEYYGIPYDYLNYKLQRQKEVRDAKKQMKYNEE